jgi:hypothetical protein
MPKKPLTRYEVWGDVISDRCAADEHEACQWIECHCECHDKAKIPSPTNNKETNQTK